MAVSDNGGFDLSIEVTEELLSAAAGGQVIPQHPAAQDRDLGDMRLRVHIDTLTPAGLDVQAAETILLRGDFAGVVTVLSASVGGVPIAIPQGMSTAALQGTFAIRSSVAVGTVNGVRGVVMTPDGAGSTSTVDENAFFASPIIQILLAAAYIYGGPNGEAAYQQRRSAMSAALKEQTTAAVVAAAATIPQTLALAEPAGLTFVAVRTTTATLKVLVSIVLPPGDPALATTVTVRRDALGKPLDHAALVINNSSILSTVRVAVSGALGISSGFGPWFASHPSLLLGATPLAVPVPVLIGIPGSPPAATATVDLVHCFVNAAGMLQIDLRVRAVLWASLATVTTTATVTAAFVASVAAGRLTFGLGPPTITTSSDVSISPSLYVMAVMVGAAGVVVLLSMVDLFAGPFVDAVIAAALPAAGGALAFGLTLPLAGTFSALTVVQTTGVEPGAPSRVFAFGGFTLALDQAQDVTVRLA